MAPYKQEFAPQLFGTLTSLAVGDIDNDGYNDIVAGSVLGARLFFNTANTNGDIDEQAVWGTANPDKIHLVAIGDIASPGTGGETRTDGWNDLVVASANASGAVAFSIFINQRGPSVFFTTVAQQVLVNPPSPPVGGEEVEGGQALCSDPPNHDDPLTLQLVDVKTNGGLSIVFTVKCRDNDIFLFHNAVNPAPAPPNGVSVVATPPDQFGYRHPKVSWAPNKERDITGYDVWRRIVSAIDCGNGVWYFLSTTGGSTWDYTDNSISTAGMGSQCTAEYKVLARDASSASDFSAVVPMPFSNLFFKRSEGNAGELAASKPSSYLLHAAYPNPFNPSTEIKFDLPLDGFVTLNVFDMLGRKVGELVNENRAAGYHTVTWEAKDLASGVYFARFTATDANGSLKFSRINKLILNK